MYSYTTLRSKQGDLISRWEAERAGECLKYIWEEELRYVTSDEIIACVCVCVCVCVCKKVSGREETDDRQSSLCPYLIILGKEKGTRGRSFSSSKENSCSYRVTCFCFEETRRLVFWLRELFGLVNKKMFLAFAIDIIIIIIIIIIITTTTITIITSLDFRSLSA